MVATSAGGSAVYCFKAFRCLLQVLPCPTLTRYVSCPSFFLTVKGPFQAAERPLFSLGSKQRTGSPIFRLDSLALLLSCFCYCLGDCHCDSQVVEIITHRLGDVLPISFNCFSDAGGGCVGVSPKHQVVGRVSRGGVACDSDSIQNQWE